MVGKMKIQLTKNREVYNFCKPYVIAEIGANHNGDMDLAKLMIDSAVESGCDAVKFQSWSKTSIVSKSEYEANKVFTDSKKKHFGSLEEMVDKYYLRKEQHYELRDYCTEKGIDFSSTPFNKEEVDLLNDLDVEFFKVASMDINNLPLLKYMAQFNKPILLSTGMATIGEIEQAVNVIEEQGNKKIVILHCIAIYPPENRDINLKNIVMLQNHYEYPVGFSDHTIGYTIPLASVALGAAIIEKHFTTDKDLSGWDHEISANPEEMKVIVDGAKDIHESLGVMRRVVSPAEKEKKKIFRRSIVVNGNMKKGDIITEQNIAFKRPGTGIPPDELKYILGKKLAVDCEFDHIITKLDIT
jgi:sialic acid synthase SpsE